MNNLLKFFLKYKNVLLFLFLELLALGLVFQNNRYHKAIFLNASNVITGTIFSSVKAVSSYLYLNTENKKLAEENTRLKNNVEQIEYTLIPTLQIEGDSLSTDSMTLVKDDMLILSRKKQFDYLPAQIISNAISRKRNYIYLNKGTSDGIVKDMGIIEPNGVVGVVVNATKHYSLVMPLINIQSSLSVKIKNQEYFGTLKWLEVNHKFAEIIEVPNHVILSEGDTIVTSGYSQIFPQGNLIGFVEKAEKVKGSSFLKVKIRLSVNFANLNYVYAIRNNELEEFKELNIE